jgi:rhodanese-related sulfurtransferase
MTHDFLLQNIWLIALAAGSGLMLFWPVLTKTGARRVSVAQATALMNQKKALLLDIRKDDVIEKSGEISQAKRLNLASLEDKQLLSLAKSKETPLILLAQQGGAVGAAVRKLKAVGYTDVLVLDGGFEAWQEAGMPIKKTKPQSQPS